MANPLQEQFDKSVLETEEMYRKKLNSLLGVDSDPLTDPDVMAGARASAENNRKQESLFQERMAADKKASAARQAQKEQEMAKQMEAQEFRRRDQEAAEKFKRQPLAEGSFPDLTGDGKVTQADVLRGRGVFNKGGASKDNPKNVPESGMFQGLSLLGVPQSTIDKMTNTVGDIPKSVVDSIIYLGDKARDAGIIDKPERKAKAEGSMLMPEEGMPVDTYPNIPADEMDEALESQLPDAEMEENYIQYVMDESLDDEEQDYLVGVLQNDPKLSDILDKVITVASEFSGAGEVEGPGTGVSDSIPARLSDGEFVFTRKATDQIGADNLQRMMDDAERAYDGGYQMKAIGGYMQEDPEEQDSPLTKTDEEIKKLMMGANKIPSLQ